MSPSDSEEGTGGWIRVLLLFVALVLGALTTWSSRGYMNPDGISYLDMGDAFWRQDWHTAISSYWSPLYGWLLGFVLNLFHVQPWSEFFVVHVVNFGIYALALLSFDFFLRGVIAYHGANARRDGNSVVTLPGWAWYGLGYTLFIWSSIDLITISEVTPDMLNSAFVYLASGVLTTTRTNSARLRPFLLLGLFLGFGYLTRASMLPLAFVFLGAALASPGGPKRNVFGVFLGLVVFLMITAPFIVGLSLKEGHLAFGDSGKLSYISEVNGASKVHWRGGPPACGSPRHPARRVLETPAVYEFGTPIVATYPLWFDPSYWNKGMIPCLDVRKELRALVRNTGAILAVAFGGGSPLVVAIIAIAYWNYSAGYGRWPIKGLVDSFYLLIIACAGFAAYAWVLVVPRYIAVFVTLLWVGLFSSVRVPRTPAALGMMRSVMVASTAVMLSVAIMLVITGRTTRGEFRSGQTSGESYWEVAQGLGRMGIRPGDKVAALGTSFEVYWARLARVRVVAEIPDGSVPEFWAADPTMKSKAIAVLFSTGAKAIVAADVPRTSGLVEWQSIGTTGFFVYSLSH